MTDASHKQEEEPGRVQAQAVEALLADPQAQLELADDSLWPFYAKGERFTWKPCDVDRAQVGDLVLAQHAFDGRCYAVGLVETKHESVVYLESAAGVMVLAQGVPLARLTPEGLSYDVTAEIGRQWFGQRKAAG